jgi:glycosyltransferase involved in cell wall biosynthesis
MNDISTMIKVTEYMALAKPMVQFNLKEGRFSAGDASLYSEAEGGAHDFAGKILWLLDHPEERVRMGATGRRRVEEELAWRYSVKHLIAAYERAFDKRERRDGGAPSPVEGGNDEVVQTSTANGISDR